MPEITADNLSPIRLDVFISENMPEVDVSRTRASAWIKEGFILVDGVKETKPSYPVQRGQIVSCSPPPVKESRILPEDLPLEILYQDESIAVVNKPAGMVVHPAAGNPDGTLVNALMFHLDHLSGIGGEMRPGIVHRLDKDTSGIMLVAKNDAAHEELSAQFSSRRMEKHYRAVVLGHMKQETGLIEAPIARSKTDRKKMAIDPQGKYAATEWKVLNETGNSTLMDVHILTGRTHQIRVHMSSVGHPVLGDPIYGKGTLSMAPRLMLHAYSIRFHHPITHEECYFFVPAPF